ncbi:MAG: hypothetical protein IJ834_08035 [Paludibacteraceae bacterium]|nr:hypothetical protein [Paludibacteraceae bacterium]
MNQLLVVAEPQELQMAQQLFPNIPHLITGVGAINIIRALQNLPKDTHIINVGYAGSANFPISSLVQVTSVALNHPNVNYQEPSLNCTPITPNTNQPLLTAPCYTGVDFCLQSNYHDCVFDMELAFIAALDFKKLSSIKFVSDNLSLHDYHQLSNAVI